MSFLKRRKAREEELYVIADNLKQLYTDGISITSSLKLLLEIPLHKDYKDSIGEILKGVEEGKELSKAFEEYPDLYPSFFIGLISVGENSGKLGEVLDNLAMYYKKIADTKKQIIGELTYPIFLSVAVFILFILLTTFVVPTFYDIYSSMGSEIPGALKFIHNINENVKSNPLQSLAFVICWGIGIFIILLKLIIPTIKERVIVNLKIYKTITEYIIVLILSVISSSGVSLQIGLEYCEKSFKVSKIKEILKELYNEILLGRELSEAVFNTKVISNYAYSIIKLGEESGSMDVRLRTLEERLKEKTMENLKKKLSYLQPILIIFMALAIGVFILIFVLPLFDMLYSGGI